MTNSIQQLQASLFKQDSIFTFLFLYTRLYTLYRLYTCTHTSYESKTNKRSHVENKKNISFLSPRRPPSFIVCRLDIRVIYNLELRMTSVKVHFELIIRVTYSSARRDGYGDHRQINHVPTRSQNSRVQQIFSKKSPYTTHFFKT